MKTLISLPDRPQTGLRSTFCIWLTVGATCFLLPSSHAASLFEDGFNYTSGGVLSGNGAWANSYSLITVSSGSLTYPGVTGISPSGNEASIAANHTAGTATTPFWTASTFGTAASSSTVYASFLLNYTGMTSPANYTFMGMLPAAGNGGNFIAANDPIDLAEHATANGLGYTLGIRTYGQSATYYGTSGVGAWNNVNAPVLSLNTAYLIVMKYDFTAKKASLFINPSLTGGEGTPIATTSAVGTAATDLDQIYFRAAGVQSAGGSVDSPPYLIDDVRVGTSWADVIVVPEPATFALIGLGLLGLGVSRRMRC